MTKTHPVLRTILKDAVTLRVVTRTVTDSRWDTRHESTEDYQVKAKILIITQEDLRWIPGGTLRVGDARGFFFPSYQIGDKTIAADIGNRVIWQDLVFEILRVSPYIDGQVQFRECYLKRVD